MELTSLVRATDSLDRFCFFFALLSGVGMDGGGIVCGKACQKARFIGEGGLDEAATPASKSIAFKAFAKVDLSRGPISSKPIVC